VQAVVSKAEMSRLLPDDSPRCLAIATWGRPPPPAPTRRSPWPGRSSARAPTSPPPWRSSSPPPIW
jgi:hypothetical protein